MLLSGWRCSPPWPPWLVMCRSMGIMLVGMSVLPLWAAVAVAVVVGGVPAVVAQLLVWLLAVGAVMTVSSVTVVEAQAAAAAVLVLA